MDKQVRGVLFFIVSCLFLALLPLFVVIARADGKITYCFIMNEYSGYRVMGHRDWRPDAIIGVGNSPEGADKIFRESAICSEFLKK